MAGALKKAGIPHELITIRGGEHGFDADLRSKESARAIGSVLAFLQERLK
jgi:hypothetical protein